MKFRLRIWVLLPFLTMGCAAVPMLPAGPQQNVDFHPDDTLVCAASNVNKCAEPSPLRQLAEEASSQPADAAVHYVNIIEIGEHSLMARLDLIRAARHSIRIQQYIWHPDASGLLIFDELIKAARRGVQVSVIGDQLSTLGNPRLMARIVMAHKNLRIKIYNPSMNRLKTAHMALVLGGLPRLGRANHRMHNKIMVIDDKIAILGGRNHENRYFDLGRGFNFKDRDVLIIGPVVGDMLISFREFWDAKISVPAQHLTDVQAHLKAGDLPAFDVAETMSPGVREIERKVSDKAKIRELFVARAFRVSGRITFFADPPGRRYGALEDPPGRPLQSVYKGIYGLRGEIRDEIVLQTPYLIFRHQAFEELSRLREEKPNLRILVSTNSLASIDHFAPYAIMVKQRRRILGHRLIKSEPYSQ